MDDRIRTGDRLDNNDDASPKPAGIPHAKRDTAALDQSEEQRGSIRVAVVGDSGHIILGR